MSGYQLGYFAHSKEIYNTKEEAEVLDALKERFYGHIICPNNHIGELFELDPYLEIVEKVDLVFVYEYEGYVGKGVYGEVEEALLCNIPVYVYRRKKLLQVINVEPSEKGWNFKKYGRLTISK